MKINRTYKIKDQWNTGRYEIIEYVNHKQTGNIGPRFDSKAAAKEYAKQNNIKITE